MREPPRAAVLGLGLMGGSIARDLASTGWVVSGWDSDAGTLERAVQAKVVQPLARALEGLEQADLVILAVPVRTAVELLPELAGRISADGVLTDLASTKRTVVSAAVSAGLGKRFVGSHPLTGDHRSGWEASRTGLFEGAPVFITGTGESEEASIERVCGVWRGLGARPKRIGAVEHDRLMAWVSHAPQALSSALGLALDDAGLRRADLGPGGRAMTRLAGSSPAMWADIFIDNSEEVAPVIQSVISRLRSLTGAMERGDVMALKRLLEHSRGWGSDEG